jgi:hypothetical protein
MKMTKDEMAQEMLRRCEAGALQKDAAAALGQELGISPRSLLNHYCTLIPSEQRPAQSRQGAARKKREREMRERRDAQQVTVRCACGWHHDGLLGEGRRAFAEHRAGCAVLTAA